MSEASNVSACQAIFARNSSECHNFPYYFIVFSFGTNLVLGFPANCYVLWLSMKEMIRRESLEVFVFNTSLAEVIFNFSLPFVIKQYFYSCSYSALGVFETLNLLLPGYIAFLIIKVFTCLMVLKALRHPGPGDDVKQRDGVNQDKAKAFWIIQVVLVSSVLTYGPYLAFFTTKVFTCLMVLKALRHPGPSDDAKQRDRVNRDKVKAFRIIQIVLVSSVLTDHVRVCAASPLSQKS
ncbi:hypothetical protein Q8A67_016125 [Cirrhinus molitorella]|uniref:G-protein coupled receptors family 1 profile domain-containing protein n=1 Tax=Cirrhinus molitorella TaxID=172907 RepID=A0AA88TKH7_9TELE|nr:hypothetical protein Q8A67_016125 [Cirrhinus molitorella]